METKRGPALVTHGGRQEVADTALPFARKHGRKT